MTAALAGCFQKTICAFHHLCPRGTGIDCQVRGKRVPRINHQSGTEKRTRVFRGATNMNRPVYRSANKWLVWLMAMAIVMMPLAAFAQTRITYHPNKFKTTDDVKLGRQAAAEAEQQFPLLRDAEVNAYVERVGQRLVASIPSEFQHPEFRYYFKVVNARDINAFALPGGPMFVNRGMIEAAHTEGEVVGVMAHELSHVVLRHGTAQASKATKYQFGAIAGAIAGAIIGGNLGTAISEGTRFGLGAMFLKYPREYEKQADLEGSHIMARAGY